MNADVRGQRYVHVAEDCGMRQQSATLTHHTTVDGGPQRFPAALKSPLSLFANVRDSDLRRPMPLNMNEIALVVLR